MQKTASFQTSGTCSGAMGDELAASFEADFAMRKKKKQDAGTNITRKKRALEDGEPNDDQHGTNKKNLAVDPQQEKYSEEKKSCKTNSCETAERRGLL